MDIRDRRGLKAAAGESLRQASFDPKKLILIHTGATILMALLSVALGYYLDHQISGTGGLSGIGTRAILETVQSVVDVAYAVAMPFWQFGWLLASVRIFRRKQAEPATLLEGFRRFHPVARLTLRQMVLYCGIAVACAYAAAILFGLTPWSDNMMVVAEQMMAAADPMAMDEQMLMALLESMVPYMLMYLAVLLVVAVPVFYRLRMAHYFLIDHPGVKARTAMRASRQMMKGNVWALVKLDLSFWWYYLLEILVSAVLYLDLILPMMGIALPVSEGVMAVGAMVLYCLCQLGLYWWRKAEVDVTYAAVYETLKTKLELPQVQNNG